MRLSGIHDISKRWPKHARNRAIANLANQAKRRLFATNEELLEIFDRIDKLASYVPKALEAEREYILKGKRYAQEDSRAAFIKRLKSAKPISFMGEALSHDVQNKIK